MVSSFHIGKKVPRISRIELAAYHLVLKNLVFGTFSVICIKKIFESVITQIEIRSQFKRIDSLYLQKTLISRHDLSVNVVLGRKRYVELIKSARIFA